MKTTDQLTQDLVDAEAEYFAAIESITLEDLFSPPGFTDEKDIRIKRAEALVDRLQRTLAVRACAAAYRQGDFR